MLFRSTPKLFQLGADLLVYTIPRWIEVEIKPQPQDESKATYTRTFAKDDGRIDWTTTANEISQMIRAFTPWPGCYTTWQGKTLQIIETIPLPEIQSGHKPGQVIKLGEADADIGVITGNGILLLRTVQLEGKRLNAISDFTQIGRAHV